MIKRLIPIFMSVGGTLALILFGADFSSGIRCGLSVCGEVVIPSLFPFMVLANFIAASGAANAIAKPLSVITRPIFKLPKCCAAPIFLSYISGYPVGAVMASRLYGNGQISKSDAERMLTFTVNSSPAMAIFAVGVGMLGSKSTGILVFSVHVISSVLTGVIFTRIFLKSKLDLSAQTDNNMNINTRVSVADAFVNATADASAAMLNICGCVMLFAGITEALDGFSWLAPILEVTVGCRCAADFGVPLVAAVLGFGGLSVIMQVLTLSKGLIRTHILILSRITHGVISYLLCHAVMSLLPDKVISVFSTAVPQNAATVNITAPVSAALLLLGVVVMWSAKKAEN